MPVGTAMLRRAEGPHRSWRGVREGLQRAVGWTDTRDGNTQHALARAHAYSTHQSDSGGGTGLLQYWRHILTSIASNPAHWTSRKPSPDAAALAFKDMPLRDLVHDAVRLRRGRTPSALPEEVVATLMEVYSKGLQTKQDKARFFTMLCHEFGTQAAEVSSAIEGWQKAKDEESIRGEAALLKATERVRQASEPLYAALFVPISNQHGGLKFLVDMRADLLDTLHNATEGGSALRALSEALRRSLSEWFSVGLLRLARLNWDGTSGAMLERVMRYEAVHPFSSSNPWGDLRARLAPHRRVFGFFHQSLPDEPLVLLHTALMGHAAANIDEILQQRCSGQAAEEVAAAATTAVFYSISSTQQGLAGVDLGNYLIKEAAAAVGAEFPGVRRLVTLSPLPGFRPWLETRIAQALRTERPDENEPAAEEWELLAAGEGERLERLTSNMPLSTRVPSSGYASQLTVLEWALRHDHWLEFSVVEEAVKPILMRLSAHYLLRERRRRQALDPVANFHLRNGASVWRLNWRADLSQRGREQSFGVMVNYEYVLADVARNNQRYIVDAHLPASKQVHCLLEGWPLESSSGS